MKYALTALLALGLAMPVSAQTGRKTETVYLDVKTSDLDLSSTSDTARLTSRFLNQMHVICGSAAETARDTKNIPGLLGAHRQAFANCKHALALKGEQSQVVQDAFLAALKKLGGPE